MQLIILYRSIAVKGYWKKAVRSLNEIFDPSKPRDLEFANSSRRFGPQTVQIRPNTSGTLPSPRWIPRKFRDVRLTGISQTFQFYASDCFLFDYCPDMSGFAVVNYFSYWFLFEFSD
jgi:hypothetical protein